MEAQAINGLGQDVFIKLLTTQLKYQDPLQPMESTEFITQLAQFSELDQTIAMKNVMGDVSRSVGSMSNLGVASLIGKEVQVSGSAVPHLEGRSESLDYHLGAPAKSVTIKVANSAGDVVRTMVLSSQRMGDNTIVWDGRDSNGDLLPSGEYAFSVRAENSVGDTVTSSTFTFGVVTGVHYVDGAPNLVVNGQEVPAATVSEVRGGL
jgi:flagellar basal-body rod modification protein FlgD